MPAHESVELVREQPRHSADPRIRRLRHDRVVLPRLRGEECLRIVDHDARARVGVGQLVPRPELLAAADHLPLDLDGVHLREARVREQQVRRDAGAESDAGDTPRVRVKRHGHRREQRHRRLVTRRLPPRIRGYRRVDLAVGVDGAPGVLVVVHHADGGRLSIAVEQHAVRPGRQQRSVPVHAGRHLQRLQLPEQQRHADGDRSHGSERPRHSRARECRCRHPQQHHAERDVERAAERQQPLQPEERQSNVHGAEHPGDRADRIRRVHGADARLAVAALHQMERDERQCRPGAERRRQHDRDCDRVAPQGEQRVAVRVVQQVQHYPAHHRERLPVQKQCGEREHPHRDLQIRERAHRRAEPVDAPLDP